MCIRDRLNVISSAKLYRPIQIEIYNDIARFPRDSTAFLLFCACILFANCKETYRPIDLTQQNDYVIVPLNETVINNPLFFELAGERLRAVRF